jgi:hypothetical protein
VFLNYVLNKIEDEVYSIHDGYIEFFGVHSADAFILGKFSGSRTVGAQDIPYIGGVNAERISD